VDRYSFIVVDLHHLLLAGLPAHFESYMPSHAVWSLWDMSRLQQGAAAPRFAAKRSPRRSHGILAAQ